MLNIEGLSGEARHSIVVADHSGVSGGSCVNLGKKKITEGLQEAVVAFKICLDFVD